MDHKFLKSSNSLCGNTCDICSKEKQCARISFDVQKS